MKRLIFSIFFLQAVFSFGQIKNPGFETWDTTYTHSNSNDLTTLYSVPNPLGGIARGWKSLSAYGICRTTDSYSGNYSFILHNWYSYVQEVIEYKDSISSRPRFLTGYYKYSTGGANGLAQGQAEITLTRYNGSSHDTIGFGQCLFDSSNAFRRFVVPVSYRSFQLPDSIKIKFINADKDCGHDIVCNLLYLDDLALADTLVSFVENREQKMGIFVCPNPAGREISIETADNDTYSLMIYDIYGNACKSGFLTKKAVISLDDLCPGIYFINLHSDKGNRSVSRKISKF